MKLMILVAGLALAAARPWGGSEQTQRGYAVEADVAVGGGGSASGGYTGTAGSNYGSGGLRGGNYGSSGSAGSTYGAGGRQGGAYAGGSHGYSNRVRRLANPWGGSIVQERGYAVEVDPTAGTGGSGYSGQGSGGYTGPSNYGSGGASAYGPGGRKGGAYAGSTGAGYSATV